MKTKLPLLLISLSALGTTHAFAQAERGNGGIAVVCRDTSNQITSARLLDLWEPETFTAYQDFEHSIDEQLNQAILKIETIKQSIGEMVKDRMLAAKKDLISVTRPLPLTNDAFPDYAPEKGCSFEQVAKYGYVKSLGIVKLRVFSEIYDSPKFSNSDRAALILHEALYALDREINDVKNSEHARWINSIVFSDRSLSEQDKIILETMCKLPETLRFYPLQMII